MTSVRPHPEADPVMHRVARRMAERDLTQAAAARLIGVGVQTLQKHMSGEHARSDSVRKYENWLEGRGPDLRTFTSLLAQSDEETIDDAERTPPSPPADPLLVVDLFSGCGGLSLGFDLLDEGRWFRTTMALDSEPAPIRVLNRNVAKAGGTKPPGHVVDLTEFGNEAEFLTYYVLNAVLPDEVERPREALDQLHGGAFRTFLRDVAAADTAFLDDLREVRATTGWKDALTSLDRSCLQQTSVLGFHRSLRLPRPSLREPVLGRLLWHDPDARAAPEVLEDPDAKVVRRFERRWDGEVQALRARSDGNGPGQLKASARRIAAFTDFLDEPAMTNVRRAWAIWQARRTAARSKIFDDSQYETAIRGLYEDRCRVSVLVGGPPCQGFSRIGRGKIRSLLDVKVHVQGDEEAGDARNLLFRQYVMVLDALRPDVFLFENVQHFQSTVKVNDVSFEAADVLSEAIAGLSEGEARYDVHSRVVDASRHGIPQMRRRFFMAGVRDARSESDAVSCLELPARPTAVLGQALAGLPDPVLLGGEIDGPEAMKRRRQATADSSADHPFDRWIAAVPVHASASDGTRGFDAHVARASRTDDAELFALMGPGKRWMDYRSDASATIRTLSRLLQALASARPDDLARIVGPLSEDPDVPQSADELKELAARVDGSLPLRLLMEQISDRIEAPHHLLMPNYLKKRDGNHGDWLARMDAARPSKTMVSHMGKDTYGYVHPAAPRTISVREAARVQTFPDWFEFGQASLTDAFKMIGNAVPPMLSHEIALCVAEILETRRTSEMEDGVRAAS